MAIIHYDEYDFGLNNFNRVTFDYDDTEFGIWGDGWPIKNLHYIGKETDGSKIKIPDGIKNCDNMFAFCNYLETPPVIPNGVVSCRWMFSNCSSLKAAPVIPHSVRSQHQFMFENCSEDVQEAGNWNIKHRGISYYDYQKGLSLVEKYYPNVHLRGAERIVLFTKVVEQYELSNKNPKYKSFMDFMVEKRRTPIEDLKNEFDSIIASLNHK